MAAVNFELVSPEKLLLSEEVDMVLIPGSEGDFGVLPGHAPMISSIRPGVICVFAGGKVEKRLFVAGGFAEVTPERCTVLAEKVTSIEELQLSELEQLLKNSKEDLAEAQDGKIRAEVEKTIAVLEAKIQAVTAPVYN